MVDFWRGGGEGGGQKKNVWLSATRKSFSALLFDWGKGGLGREKKKKKKKKIYITKHNKHSKTLRHLKGHGLSLWMWWYHCCALCPNHLHRGAGTGGSELHRESDTQLLLSFQGDSGTLSTFRTCLSAVVEWINLSCFKLNSDKTEVLFFGTSSQPNEQVTYLR
mgnify:CR=1 FL=1